MSDASCCNCCKEISEEEMLKQVDAVLDDYKGSPGALIPVLQIAQGMFGYIPKVVLKRISKVLDKPYSEVAGVVTFYSLFYTAPRGKYIISVCLGTACYVRGGKDVLDSLKKELKIDVGETTEDRLFTLEIGRCFGACGLAPALTINNDVHQRVKPLKIAELLKKYRVAETSSEKEAN